MSVELAAGKKKAKKITPGPVPAEALDYFKRKKLKPAFRYTEVWQEEHDLAFTVAKVMERDLLADVRDTIEQAIAEGRTFEQWKKDVLPALSKSGWMGDAEGNVPSRLKVIYETNMRVARANGQEDRAQRTKNILPYFKYEIGPSKIHRPQHLAWNGLIFKIDDPFWQAHTPPCAYGCNCRKRQISRLEAERLGGESEAPREKQVKWELPDGRTETVPDGVHPSFAYRKSARERREQLDKELKAPPGKGPTEKTRIGAEVFALFKEFVTQRIGRNGDAKRIATELTDGGRRALKDLLSLCPNDGDTTGLTKFDSDVKTARKYVEGELSQLKLVGRKTERTGIYPTELARAVGKFL